MRNQSIVTDIERHPRYRLILRNFCSFHKLQGPFFVVKSNSENGTRRRPAQIPSQRTVWFWDQPPVFIASSSSEVTLKPDCNKRPSENWTTYQVPIIRWCFILAEFGMCAFNNAMERFMYSLNHSCWIWMRLILKVEKMDKASTACRCRRGKFGTNRKRPDWQHYGFTVSNSLSEYSIFVDTTRLPPLSSPSLQYS